MPARKNRPVLYEKVRSTRSRRDPASWKPAEPRPAESSPPVKSSRVALLEHGLKLPAWRWPSNFRYTNGRVQISLGWPGIAVTAIASLFVLVVTFQMGSRAARQTAPVAGKALPQNPETANTAIPRVPGPNLGGDLRLPQPPAEKVAVPPRSEPAAAKNDEAVAKPPVVTEQAKPEPPVVETPYEFKKGYSYVTVQYFKLSQANVAEACQRMLRDQGIDTVIVRGDRDIQVIATEPFLLKQRDAAAREREKQRCEDLKKRIRKFGKDVFADAYRFALNEPIEREK